MGRILIPADMQKILGLFFIFYFSIGFVAGQNSRQEDVLRLTNHWVLRGTITLQTDSIVQIQTRDGNVFVFPRNQVGQISREAAWTFQHANQRRWKSYTELGPLIAGKTNVNGVTTAAFSFQ